MPDSDCPCEPVWISSPSVLLGTTLNTNDLCESNNMNAFTRGFLVFSALGAILFPLMGVPAIVLVLLAVLLLYGRWLYEKVVVPERTAYREAKKDERSGEGFQDAGATIRPDMKDPGAFPNAPEPIPTRPGVAVVTRPTARNPFMNVLIDEIKFNPTRPAADFASDPNNQVVLDDFFRVQWTSDPTDVFGRTQSQRQFYTMPSTSIPNDQGSFQNWLYLIPGKTCKEGGRDACYPATNGAPVTWLSQPN